MGLFTRLRRFGKSLNMNYDEIKDWYDGYQFGNTRVYCPWDVVNYCDALRSDPEAPPKNYWSNTSSNEVVRRFIVEMDKGTARRETVSAWRFPTWRYARSSRRRSWSCLKKTSPRTGKC